MLELAKLIHQAIGVESPRAFIAVFAIIGLLLFAALGWLVDKGYRVAIAQPPIAHAAPSSGAPRPATASPAPPAPAVVEQSHPDALRKAIPKTTRYAIQAATPVGKSEELPQEATMSASSQKEPMSKPVTPDRSVKIGDNSPITNSAIITGDNARVEVRPGPPEPWRLTPLGQRKMAEALSECPNGELALVCIGRGCGSIPSVAGAFQAAGWSLETTQIGILCSVGDPIDVSVGIHVMDGGAPLEAAAALVKALRATGLKFSPAPFHSYGKPKLNLVIGNPQ